MRSWRRAAASWASVWWIAVGCASAPSGSRIAPYWEQWDEVAEEQAIEAFALDAEGVPHQRGALYGRLDYCDAYGRAVNAALGKEPTEEEPEVSWWGRFWRWVRD